MLHTQLSKDKNTLFSLLKKTIFFRFHVFFSYFAVGNQSHWNLLNDGYISIPIHLFFSKIFKIHMSLNSHKIQILNKEIPYRQAKCRNIHAIFMNQTLYFNVMNATQMLRFILPKRLFHVCISYYGFNLIKIRNFRLVYFHYFLRSHIQKHFLLLGLYSFF